MKGLILGIAFMLLMIVAAYDMIAAICGTGGWFILFVALYYGIGVNKGKV